MCKRLIGLLAMLLAFSITTPSFASNDCGIFGGCECSGEGIFGTCDND